MANYISDRELRRLERERKREEMERERDRLTRQLEDREHIETRNMEDYREELFRIRREREEMKRQHELDRQKYVDQKRKVEEIERRKEEEEKRKREMERMCEEERIRIEKERRRIYEEEKKKLEELERREKEEERIVFGKKKLEELERREKEEELIDLEKKKLEELERREKEEELIELEKKKYEEERKIYEDMERRLKEEETLMKEKVDRPLREEPSRIDDGCDNVFKEKGMEKGQQENTLRRQSEAALQHLKRRNTSIEKELRQLNKTRTSDRNLYLSYDTHENIKREDRVCEEEKTWITIDEYEHSGYETDDEIKRIGDDIETLKLKDTMMLEEMNYKMNLKREREELKRQEACQRRLEKQRLLETLKEEQRRLLSKLKKHEDTINALSSKDSDSDGEISHPGKHKILHPKHHLPVDKEQKIDREKFMVPKLPHLTEENFEEWKIEVEVMVDSKLYQRGVLLHAVRNSLSKASKRVRNVLPTIDPKATTREILEKLETIYGDRRSGESHLADFYKAKQMKNENVAEWGVRLETILLKAERKGQINREQREQMLMKRFWKYLQDDRLKLSTRIFYEKCLSFEELLREIRIEEREMNTNSDSSDKESRKDGNTLDKILKRMDKLEDSIKESDLRGSRDIESDRYERSDRWQGRFPRGRARYRWQENGGYGRRDRRSDYSYETYDDRRNRRDFNSNWRGNWRKGNRYQERNYGNEEDFKFEEDSDTRRKESYQRSDRRDNRDMRINQANHQDSHEKKEYTSTNRQNTNESKTYERNKGENKGGNRSGESRNNNTGYQQRGCNQNKYRGGRHQSNM